MERRTGTSAVSVPVGLLVVAVLVVTSLAGAAGVGREIGAGGSTHGCWMQVGVRVDFEGAGPALCGYLALLGANELGRGTHEFAHVRLGPEIVAHAAWVVEVLEIAGWVHPVIRVASRVVFAVARRHMGRWTWDGESD